MPNILEDFDEKFIYDYFDSTGLQILGLREANRPATDDEVTAYISDKIRQVLEGMEKPNNNRENIDHMVRLGYNARNAELNADIEAILSGLERK